MTEAILLFLVFIGEVGLAAIVYLAGNFTEYPTAIFFLVYFLQFIASSVQAGISDHGCRKTSLIFSLIAICLGQIFFLLAFKYSWMIVMTILFYGFLGNITPIARAGLNDTRLRNDFRLSIGLSTVAIALGWVLTMFTAYYLPAFLACLIVTILCAFSILTVFFIKDNADYKFKEVKFSFKEELKLIYLLMKNKCIAWGLVGYLFAEIAFYQIFIRGEEHLDDSRVRLMIFTWVLGYCIGVALQKIFIHRNEQRGVIVGSILSLVTMVLLALSAFYTLKNIFLSVTINMLFSAGFGFFIPCLFSMISKKFGLHLQGKFYGLIDAVDSFAIIVAVSIIFFAEWSSMHLGSLMLTSFIFIIFSLYCFLLSIKEISKMNKIVTHL